MTNLLGAREKITRVGAPMKQQTAGFTLMELMISVAIIGILAAFAFPRYMQFVDNAHRNDAQAALISLAAHLERRFTENNSYCDSGSVVETDCGAAANGDKGKPTFFAQTVPLDGGAPIYNLTIESVSATTFEVRAVRVAGQRMANDDCGDFTYTQTGRKDQVNETETCW
jgi:type IV pilus assembly protein PilE